MSWTVTSVNSTITSSTTVATNVYAIVDTPLYNSATVGTIFTITHGLGALPDGCTAVVEIDALTGGTGTVPCVAIISMSTTTITGRVYCLGSIAPTGGSVSLRIIVYIRHSIVS